MGVFKEYYRGDMARYGKDQSDWYVRHLLKYLRKAQTCKNKFLQGYYRLIYKCLCKNHGLEIPWRTKIGKGLYLGHVYNITINSGVVIGDNCNIHKGVTIGQTNRGNKKGVPTIGNCVWIGINATIVGNITIGDDVLIAPNSYVNCDIPSHSVVLGNPCMIKPRENATEEYINNRV